MEKVFFVWNNCQPFSLAPPCLVMLFYYFVLLCLALALITGVFLLNSSSSSSLVSAADIAGTDVEAQGVDDDVQMQNTVFLPLVQIGSARLASRGVM